MKYIRTKDGKIFDLEKENYIVNGSDLILHRQYETCGGPEIKPGQMFVTSIAIIQKHNEYIFVGSIKKESDNITDLLEVGDLIEFQVNGKRAGIVEIEEYNIINSHDNETITKIYTKQDNNYILEWRK